MTSKLKIIPLGGLGEIGKNMTVIEYEDEIIVIDAGIMFPQNDMLGIDLIIPDFKYLMDKLDKVQAVLVTHGHEDHVGGLPHLMEHVDAPIYATPLTAGLIEVKLGRVKYTKNSKIVEIQAGDTFTIGEHFTIEPFHVTHSIPDCVGFGITTPVGLIVYTGDYKFDHTPADGWAPDFAKLAEFSGRGVLCLFADSTNADRPGWTKSETIVVDALDGVFRDAKGRIIVATFASLISRIQIVADMAVKYGRKMAVTGRSMRDNVKMARRLGYLHIDEDLLIDISQAKNFAAKDIVIMATGTQGEPSAVMSRLAQGRHRQLEVHDGDTIVFSAHAIPGNEEMVYRVVNRLLQRGAHVVYESIAEVHVSGHASQEEMKLMLSLVRPKFLVPIHGELRHLTQHGMLAEEMGMAKENITIVENGTPLFLDENSVTVGKRLAGGYVFIDGDSVGDIGWPIVRDRENLAENGIFFAVVTVNGRGIVTGKSDFISRGFVDLRKEEKLLNGAELSIKQVAESFGNNSEQLNGRVEKALDRYFYAETGRRPLVQVVIKKS